MAIQTWENHSVRNITEWFSYRISYPGRRYKSSVTLANSQLELANSARRYPLVHFAKFSGVGFLKNLFG